MIQMRRCLSVVTALIVASLPLAAQQLAATPPMGWNSWNYFAGKVNDTDIRAAADPWSPPA